MNEAVNNTGPFRTPRAVSVRDTLGVAASLRLHWPEYLMEAGEMSLYMFCTCSFATLLMVKTAANPEGLPKSVFDDLQAQLAANRSKFYRDLPEGPFYGFNRPGVKSVEATIANWWRQG